MKYAIIPADGHTGPMGVVYSSHGQRSAAISAARGYNKRSQRHKVQVIECAAVKGATISMRLVGNLYPRVPLDLEDSFAATTLAVSPL